MLLKGPERLWAHLGLEGLGSLAVSQQHPPEGTCGKLQPQVLLLIDCQQV